MRLVRETRQITAMASRRVLLCGYYGEHNLGDDALLEALLAALPSAVVPVVTAHDEAEVQQRFGVATVQRRSLRQVLSIRSWNRRSSRP